MDIIKALTAFAAALKPIIDVAQVDNQDKDFIRAALRDLLHMKPVAPAVVKISKTDINAAVKDALTPMVDAAVSKAVADAMAAAAKDART